MTAKEKELIERVNLRVLCRATKLWKCSKMKIMIERIESFIKLEQRHRVTSYIKDEEFQEIENEVEHLESAEDMEKVLSQEGLAIDDPVRMYLKDR